MLIATWITRQVLFNGAVEGLVIGLLAMGIVLIYRSTKVINFAVGNMGLPGTALFALLVINYNFPFWLALALVLIMGTLIGTVIEFIFVRRLFNSPRVILLVATVGVAQLMQFVILSMPDVEAAGQRYPNAIGRIFETGGLRIQGAQIMIILVVPVVALALGYILNRTTFGKTVTASANNSDLARLSGINPKLVSTFVWTIAGFVSTLSMILLSAKSGSVTGLENLGSTTLAKALAASVIAGMFSFPRAVLAGILIGVVEAGVSFNFLEQTGLSTFIFFLAVLLAVYLQSRGSQDESVVAFAPRVKPIPARLQSTWWTKQLSMILGLVGLVIAIALPLINDLPSRQLLYSTVACFAICALSVTVITGWSGQLSLSQMAFAGLGALTSAALNRGLEMDVGIGSARFLKFTAPALPFLVSILLSAFIVSLMAMVIGLGALRVKGLMLAVSTFAFALAAHQYIYKRPIFSDGSSSSVPFSRGTVFGYELDSQLRYYYFCLFFLVLVTLIVGRIRHSGVGRRTIAVRDNADTAAAYTVGSSRTKLLSFGLGGAIAALGGSLLAGSVQNIPFNERFFLVDDSLRLVAMTVIGGIGSVGGAVLGAVWVVGLPAFFTDNDVVPLLTSSVGLLLLLMYFPGGFVQLYYGARDNLFEWLNNRLPEQDQTKVATTAPASLSDLVDSSKDLPETVLHTKDVEVRFGGNLAVAGVSIDVNRDEIVGLIGTNGAGKSTFMNAVGGFVSSTGVVELLGKDVSAMSSPSRAMLGLGRTFQAATLFPELTVRETVQVALEARGRTPFLATALFIPSTAKLERRRKAEATELIDFLGLGRYADSFIADLSTGTRRIVELAGLLALDARVLCLDEPTAGVAQRETEAFGPLIVNIREELGASMLIIEHDMPLIMSISDRVYCLESGSVIAEGLPPVVRNDPAVISSYLGTDDRAIERSDSAKTGA